MQIGAKKKGFNLSYIRGLWHLFFYCHLSFLSELHFCASNLKLKTYPIFKLYLPHTSTKIRQEKSQYKAFFKIQIYNL